MELLQKKYQTFYSHNQSNRIVGKAKSRQHTFNEHQRKNQEQPHNTQQLQLCLQCSFTSPK